MTPKRAWVAAAALILLLTGCLGDPFAEAYMARPTEAPIDELPRTQVFDTTENLALVVRFNQHTETVRLETIWREPSGSQAGEVQVDVPSDAENLLVQFDLEQAARTYWPPGDWKVEIRVDGTRVSTLDFAVEGDIPEGAEEEAGAADEEDAEEDSFDVDRPSNPFGS